MTFSANITLIFTDSYLQDVQEEEEEPARGSGIAKMLELSGCSQGDSSQGDGEETETARLRAALEELQAQSTMLQDELTLLTNVKGELEAELERAKEEFQMEREELEFKINELQLNRESAPNDTTVTIDPDQQEGQGEFRQQSEAHKEAEDNLPHDFKGTETSPGGGKDPEELKVQCEALARERDSALAECQHMRNILQGVETELGEKTKDFVLQYNAMKEQGASTVRGLQDKMEQLSLERDELLERVREATEEKNTLMTDIQDLKLKLEVSAGEDQKLQSSVEEQTTLACELKQSVEELTNQNEEILSQLQMKDNVSQDLKEIVKTLTEERDKTLSQLQHSEEEMQKLNSERAKAIERLLEEKEKDALLHREEKENELKSLTTEKEDEIQHLKEERDKIEEHLKEEVDRRQKTVSALELTIEDLSSEKTNLHQNLEDATSMLSKSQEARELLGSKLAALEAQLEQETSEKNHLEAKFSSLVEEAEQARTTIRALEENQAEALRNSNKEVEELRARVHEVEKEGSLLRSSLEEARGVITLDEMQKELQARITDLEQERNMLRNNLDEVVKDTEGLQKDLEEMKSVNERISEENKDLQDHVSLMTQQKDEMEIMEKERRELQEQLSEKDSLISQIRSEMAALQVSGAPGVSGSS